MDFRDHEDIAKHRTKQELIQEEITRLRSNAQLLEKEINRWIQITHQVNQECKELGDLHHFCATIESNIKEFVEK
jgi:hypothetical protein